MIGRGARVGALVAVAATVVVAVVFAGRFGTDPNLVASPLISQPAPQLSLPRLDGTGTVDPGAMEGEIVVVNFFASWCLQCRDEHADLVATAAAFADQGVQVVQVAYQDTPEAAAAFIEELGVSPETLYVIDPDSRAAIAFGIRGVPETYFIDATGVVRGKIQGAADALLLGQTIDLIHRGEDPGEQVVGDVQARPGG